MANKILKIGVMGAVRGDFVFLSEEYLSDQMKITALLETNPKSIETLREKCTISDDVKIYTDFDEFLDSGLDGVVLCNFFNEHHIYAMKAMEKGIPVLSETTAAPSFGDCVKLLECAERTKSKYMLAANCIYFRVVQEMKRIISEGKYGDPVFADAEYTHGSPPPEIESLDGYIPGWDGDLDMENLHWRNTLPRCYYNMHDLGPMLYVFDKFPKKVVAKPVVTKTSKKTLVNHDKGYVLVELEDGSVINYSGASSVGCVGKWYRAVCKNGVVESVRFNMEEDKILENVYAEPKIRDLNWDVLSILNEEEKIKYDCTKADVSNIPHHGIDLFLMLHFLKYIRGEAEPAIDVYKAVALSATGITAWYSALTGSKELEIPDLRKKEDREKVRNDFRQPFAKKYSDLEIPCVINEENKNFDIGF